MIKTLQGIKDFLGMNTKVSVSPERMNFIVSPYEMERLESYDGFRDELRRWGFTHIVICKDLYSTVSEEKL
jgi:hypothetical protein